MSNRATGLERAEATLMLVRVEREQNRNEGVIGSQERWKPKKKGQDDTACSCLRGGGMGPRSSVRKKGLCL